MPPQLPTGTVTLLFTDVEGSTRLLEHLGDGYAAVLADCRLLLRAAFEASGGLEVDTQGDAHFVAFARAGDAVAAAAAAQEALDRHAWPDGARCRVRMGLHTGEPTRTETGYVGMDVHRGARICAAAHGGQVLLSRATRDLVHDRADVRDLGEHRLKDIPHAERLYQLLVPGLESRFPPPRALGVTNLPRPATPLVGRARELEEVSALLRMPGVRLLTLTGSGGSGKTRLAVESALAVVDDFDDGAFFVSLAALEQPDQVLPAIAHTLGVRERPGEPIAETLADELGPRRLLLLLDNLERLVGAAPALAELLAACPEVTMLATSRERLHVLAEREYPLAPLSEPDAVALFEQRARAASPGFALDGDRRAAVGRIVRRLDGLPLAVELAASYARMLPPQAIAERLDRRLPFLTGGPRDLPERQRTLRATIDWSHSLLHEAERSLFAQVAVFANGFTIEAAQAASGGDEDVLPILLSLRDKSLVVAQESADERPRFLLLDTVREYALERLDDRPDAAAIRRRHAEHFVRLAERAEPELVGPEQALWLQLLEHEHENLEAALGWAGGTADVSRLVRLAGSLWRFWLIRGHLTAGARWLDEALAAEGDADPGRAAKVLLGASALAELRGDHDRARSLAERGLDVSRRLGEPEPLARALVTLANILTDEDDLDRAARLYAEGAELAREAGLVAMAAGTTTNLSYLALRQEEWERAESLAAAAGELFLSLGHDTGSADSLLNRGFAAARLGRWPVAFGSLSDGLRIYAGLGHREGIANALLGLAAAAADRGDADAAAAMLAAATSLREAVGALLEPYERDQQERTLAVVEVALGGAEIEEARTRGAALSIEEAVALGLEVAARQARAPAGGAGALRPLATRR